LSSTVATAQTERTKYSSMADWNLKAENLGPRGVNPYYPPLIPGHRYVMADPYFSSNGHEGHYRKEIEVLNDTEKFDIPAIGGKFQCAVVQEKEFVNARPFRQSLSWHCFDKRTSAIYGMGKQVWEAKDKRGSIADPATESWRVGDADENGMIEAGLVFPGIWMTGARWIIEGAEGQAFVGAEAAESGLTMRTPAGTFDNCVRTRETDLLDPEDVTDKVWCYGVGLVFDTSHGKLVEASHLKGRSPDPSPYHAYHARKTRVAAGSGAAHGQIISREEAKKIALETVPGVITDFDIEKKFGAKRYVVEIIAAANGEETDVIIEMETGKVLGTEN
jgi:uncharacterized membrane protein YkoI